MPQQIIWHRQQPIPKDMGNSEQKAHAWLSIIQVMRNAWLHAVTYPLQKAYSVWKLERQYIEQYPRVYLRVTGLQPTSGIKFRMPERQIGHLTLLKSY
ncbi:MAG: hypothetical protein D6698_06305 [Gammaproteobacteria bacterium]|nr:MAG: hypothetical protein D6698_06305 [Gammaproteobacteria bacterium]